jgi:hypothetical protein
VRLAYLWDVRRWRAVWVALTFDSLVAVALREADDGGYRGALIGIVPDDESRAGMIAVSECLPAALRDGFFDGLDDWLSEEAEAIPAEPQRLEGVDRLRFEAMRDAHNAPAFATLAVRFDGSYTPRRSWRTPSTDLAWSGVPTAGRRDPGREPRGDRR